jgi:hypothetical protein
LKNKIILYYAVVIFFCIFSGCNKSKHPKKQVITYTPIDLCLKVDVSPASIVPDSLVTLVLVWETGNSFKTPEKNCKVYIHFSDLSGNILFQDDYFLADSIVNWRANEVKSYTRIIYCPLVKYSGDVLLFAGLYDPDNCLKRFEVLPSRNSISEKFKNDYIREKLSLLQSKKNKDELSSNRIRFKEGWFEPEIIKDDNYRWSKGTAYLGLSNMGTNSVLYIEGWSDPEFLQGKQKMTLSLGTWSDNVLSDSEGYIIKKFTIPREAFCEGEICDLEIKLDQTFIPAETGKSKDYRTLGFMLREIYFGPQ